MRISTIVITTFAMLALLPASAPAEPNFSYIVVLQHGDPDAAAARDTRAHGAQVSFVYRTALRGYAARMSSEAVRRVAQTAGVAWVEADRTLSLVTHCPRPGHPHCPTPDPTPTPTPTESPSPTESPAPPPPTPSGQTVPWGVERVGARAVAGTGAGTAVYVLDTGIDSEHADLAANVGVGYAVERCRGRCVAPWSDDHGHGTHVAGTIGAIDNDFDVVGVAPQATLHAVKVLAKSGSGSLSGVIAGIDWMTARVAASGRPAVANMSLGGGGSKSGDCTATGFIGSDAFHKSICSARRAGVLFAVAAGNDGVNAAGSTPAAYDDAVITVSATSCAATAEVCSAGSDDWPWWSNYGTASAGWTSSASAPVAVAAPGVGVLSTRLGGGTTSMSGTSMATPHVAGLLARWLSANGSATGDVFAGARSALLGSAESTSGWSNTSSRPHTEPFARAG